MLHLLNELRVQKPTQRDSIQPASIRLELERRIRSEGGRDSIGRGESFPWSFDRKEETMNVGNAEKMWLCHAVVSCVATFSKETAALEMHLKSVFICVSSE